MTVTDVAKAIIAAATSAIALAGLFLPGLADTVTGETITTLALLVAPVAVFAVANTTDGGKSIAEILDQLAKAHAELTVRRRQAGAADDAVEAVRRG